MLHTAYQHKGIACVRYPRGTGPGIKTSDKMNLIPIGKAKLIRKGNGIALLAFGSMLEPALAAAEELNATVVNMRFVKPLDEALIKTMASSHDLLVTIEENVVMGGAGSAVNELLADYGLNTHILNLGLPDEHIDHGNPATMLSECGLDKTGIVNAIKNINPKRLAEGTQSA